MLWRVSSGLPFDPQPQAVVWSATAVIHGTEALAGVKRRLNQ